MSKPARDLPRIGGLTLDPLADMALPMLLNLSTAVTVWLGARALAGWAGVPILPGISLVAFLFAWESYLFTTLFAVREVDVPGALRWVELAFMAFLAKLLAALPLADGLAEAVTSLWDRWQMYAGFVLLAFAWYQGAQTARRLQYLHPGLLEAPSEQERMVRDDHVKAYEGIRATVFGQVAALAAVLGVAAWVRGDVRFWGWSWLGAGLLAQALLGAGAVLVAAQLKQRLTWALERIEASPAVFARWTGQGLSLLLVPALLALLLPAGPRLPVERLLTLLPEPGQVREVMPAVPPSQAPQGPMLPPEWMEGVQGGPRFRLEIPAWLWWTLGAAALLYVLYVAARQLAERVGGRELKGLLAILAVLAAWYLALLRAVQEMLFGVIRQALATPAEALGAVFSEAGALGRFLPFRGRVPADPRAALRYYFARLQAEARRKGMPRGVSATAAEFGRRLAEAAPEQAPAVTHLVESYQQARYSQQPVGAEQVSFARRAWVGIIRALGKK